jgi:ABC-type cobalamin/Fe3+-siderophores transport system ATPase subunit
MTSIRSTPYAAVESHESILNQAIQAINHGQRLIQIVGARGMGKTTVLNELVRRLRSPRRVIVCTNTALGESLVLTSIVQSMDPGATFANVDAGIQLFNRACILQRLQERSVLIAMEDLGPEVWSLVSRLQSLDPHPDARHALIVTAQESRNAASHACIFNLGPVTRSEALTLAMSLVPSVKHNRLNRAWLTQLHAQARGVPGTFLKLLKEAQPTCEHVAGASSSAA